MGTKITATVLEDLARAAQEATPGPWGIKEHTGLDEFYGDWLKVGPFSMIGGEAGPDERFIAAANPAVVLALINYIRELEETPGKRSLRRHVRELKDELNTYQDLCHSKDLTIQAMNERLVARMEELQRVVKDYTQLKGILEKPVIFEG